MSSVKIINKASHEEKNKIKTKSYLWNINTFSIIILILSLFILIVPIVNKCRVCLNSDQNIKQITINNNEHLKTFFAFGRNLNSGYLHVVFSVLKSLGYKNDPNATDWDLLWAHDYPFITLAHKLKNLKPHQKINHFPGCGYITNKVDLATSGLKYIPPAFKLPQEKEAFLKYAETHPEKMFVEKNNDHRNIYVKNIKDINLNSNSTFVQEFVHKPLLVSGHKFDIGIYVIITSVDPLRVYMYNGDVLLRFCPIKYYPFDEKNIDKYVVGDDYLPIWKVPALDYYYNELGFGMKETINEYLRKKGKDPSILWSQIEESIKLTLLAKEESITRSVNRFKFKQNLFEMMRFDFVADENLNIFLLEANMSPNLSSAHFAPNELLYRQVLYNLFGLLGIGERIHKNSLARRSRVEEDMLVSDKNIAVYAEECASIKCKESCVPIICQLCKPCLSFDSKNYIINAYKEHLNKGDCKRIFPPSSGNSLEDIKLENYSPENQLHIRWFQGKCKMDKSWC